MKPEQVTAWALGELDVDERQQVEAAIAVSPDAGARAREVKSFCDRLTAEFADEDATLGDERREALLALVPAKVVTFDPTVEPVKLSSRRMKQMRGLDDAEGWKAGWGIRVAAIAACALLVGVIVHEVNQPRAKHVVAASNSPTAEHVKIVAVEKPKAPEVSKSLEPKPSLVSSPLITPKPVPLPAKPAEPAPSVAPMIARVPKPEAVKTPVHRWGVATSAFTEVSKASSLSVDLHVERDGLATLKRSLDAGKLPGADFRVTDLLHSFAWNAVPTTEPLHVTASVVDAPWSAGHRVVRVQIRARDGSDEMVAREVKLEMAFNPSVVKSYRMLGYECASAGGDVTGASLRAGETVVAFFEVVPTKTDAPATELLADVQRYPDKAPKTLPAMTGVPPLKPLTGANDELVIVRVPHQATGSELVKTIELPVRDGRGTLDNADADFRWAMAVVGMGHLMRGDAAAPTWDAVRRLAQSAVAGVAERRDFLPLIDQARALVK